MGIEVTIVEPWASVVVRFAKEVGGAVGLLEMLDPEGVTSKPVGSTEDSGDCAVEVRAAKAMRATRKRKCERIILSVVIQFPRRPVDPLGAPTSA
jgi:hypothetical protein